MLRIVVPATKMFNEETSEFIETKDVVLSLEHSLVSVSKWESKWCVPFLSKKEKSSQQIIDYVKCMTLTQNVDTEVYLRLSRDNFAAIKAYIEAPMTATVITDRSSRRSNEIITSEIIYWWMVALNIPFECQKWHLNRLLMLINVCSIKQESPKKMSKTQALRSQSALNEQRRQMLNTSG